MKYVIAKASGCVDLSAGWNDGAWQHAESVDVNNFRPESSDHHPATNAKVLYDHTGLYIQFRVDDRFVMARQKGFNSSVCTDSCVEFFFQPFGKGGYFNFEQNCGGTILCYFIEDHTRGPGGFVKYSKLLAEELAQVEIFHTLPSLIEQEITEPVQWRLAIHIPFQVLEKYVGPINAATLSETPWRGNFYKCADKTSHPHWASWNPVPYLNFHWPDSFGQLLFS